MGFKQLVTGLFKTSKPDTGVTGSDVQGNKRALDVALVSAGNVTAFGEFKVESMTPRIQFDAVYGLRTVTDIETFIASGGSAEAADSTTGREFVVKSGTTWGGYGVLRSIRYAKYRPGQGILLRFTARFDTPQENNTQRAGGFTSGNELTFGYDTSKRFGILHKTGGRLEVRTLTLSAAASGAETATVTLNGTAFNISITSGTIKHNAYELGADSYTGWEAYHIGETVIFIKQSTGVADGTYSFSSTGTAAGTFAQTSAGTADIDTWYLQEDWNLKTLLGPESGFQLNPQKGNVYQVQFQYLGYGAITFSVEDPETGNLLPVHRIKYANSNDGPSLDNPALKVGWFSANTGGTTDSSVNLYGASGAAYVEGSYQQERNPDGHVNSQTGIGTTLTNVLSVRVSKVYNGYISLQEILPKLLTVAVEGTKPAIAQVLINPALSGEPDWTLHNSFGLAEIDTSASTVTVNGSTQEILSAGLSKTGGIVANISDFDVRLSRGDIITVAVKATSGTTDAVGSISWNED